MQTDEVTGISAEGDNRAWPAADPMIAQHRRACQ